MKILIANATLATLTGTETYVRDLAIGLLRRGHTPIVYAPRIWFVASVAPVAVEPWWFESASPLVMPPLQQQQLRQQS